jgi:hypothetical protein
MTHALKKNWLRGLGLLALGVGLTAPPVGAWNPREQAANSIKKAVMTKDGDKAEGEGAKANGGKGPSAALPGKPLGGFFDLSTLRSGRRTVRYRQALDDISQTLNLGTPWTVQLSCVVEFGSPSGPAEMKIHEDALHEEIRHLIENYTPFDLLRNAGKRRLKGDIIDAVNRHLVTARVRQVYWTEFWIRK